MESSWGKNKTEYVIVEGWSWGSKYRGLPRGERLKKEGFELEMLRVKQLKEGGITAISGSRTTTSSGVSYMAMNNHREQWLDPGWLAVLEKEGVFCYKDPYMNNMVFYMNDPYVEEKINRAEMMYSRDFSFLIARLENLVKKWKLLKRKKEAEEEIEKNAMYIATEKKMNIDYDSTYTTRNQADYAVCWEMGRDKPELVRITPTAAKYPRARYPFKPPPPPPPPPAPRYVNGG